MLVATKVDQKKRVERTSLSLPQEVINQSKFALFGEGGACEWLRSQTLNHRSHLLPHMTHT